MNSIGPWGKKPTSGHGATFGGYSRLPSLTNTNALNQHLGQTPRHSFWGDMDGYGNETQWDDVLSDGLLADALLTAGTPALD